MALATIQALSLSIGDIWLGLLENPAYSFSRSSETCTGERIGTTLFSPLKSPSHTFVLLFSEYLGIVQIIQMQNELFLFIFMLISWSIILENLVNTRFPFGHF